MPSHTDPRARMYPWAAAAAIRAVKTAAQAAIALLGTSAVGIMAVPWPGLASAAAGAAFLSLLTSIAGLPELSEPKQ